MQCSLEINFLIDAVAIDYVAIGHKLHRFKED